MASSPVNATVTVSYGDKSSTFDLDGTELSHTELPDGWVNRYLNNASRDHIAAQVEQALLEVTPPVGRILTETAQ